MFVFVFRCPLCIAASSVSYFWIKEKNQLFLQRNTPRTWAVFRLSELFAYPFGYRMAFAFSDFLLRHTLRNALRLSLAAIKDRSLHEFYVPHWCTRVSLLPVPELLPCLVCWYCTGLTYDLGSLYTPVELFVRVMPQATTGITLPLNFCSGRIISLFRPARFTKRQTSIQLI